MGTWGKDVARPPGGGGCRADDSAGNVSGAYYAILDRKKGSPVKTASGDECLLHYFPSLP